MSEPLYSFQSDNLPGLAKLNEEVGELMTECGQLLQVIGKLMMTQGEPIHWDGTDLHARIRDELADVQAAVTYFKEHNIAPGSRDRAFYDQRVAEKLDKFEEWSK